MTSRQTRALLGAGLTLLWTASLHAKPFTESPEGTYDGPVKTIYTKDNAPAAPKPGELQQADAVSQYGITWKLDRKVPVGQFITGDYYIVGPATVVEITPKPLFADDVEKNGWKPVNQSAVKEDRYKGKVARSGSMLNIPVSTLRAGYDSRLSDGFYDPALFQKTPVALKPGDALVSTISTPDPIDYRGYGQPVHTAAILTCVKEPVPADAFRPSYCDREQKIFLARNLKRELLYSLPKPKTAPVNLGEWARLFQRPWLDTVSWGYASPKENMPRYGQNITRGLSGAAILVHLDYPAEEKEKLLVGYVQYGVDLWGIVRAGYEGWPGHGGFGGGRKWSLIFAGLMLGDEALRDVSTRYPKVHFAENDQTKAGKSWTGHDVIFESHPGWRPYFSDTKPPSEWAAGEIQSESYRRCCTSVEWPGQALAAHLMRAQKHFNHDPFFAYVDRWMTEDHIDELKKIREASLAGKKFKWVQWWDRLITANKVERTNPMMQALWDQYRKDLPPARSPATP